MKYALCLAASHAQLTFRTLYGPNMAPLSGEPQELLELLQPLAACHGRVGTMKGAPYILN